jgi:hypothetical protein
VQLSSIPAATLRCFAHGKVDHQVMLAYLNGGSVGADSVHFGSVVVHELGHTLGLDHSCMLGAGSDKFRACAGLPESHLYHQAVMFPTLRARRSRFEQPEIKNQLRDNDVRRSSCLYGTPR